jgi:hypothetical protein
MCNVTSVKKSDFASASFQSGQESRREEGGAFSLVSGHRGLAAMMPNV